MPMPHDFSNVSLKKTPFFNPYAMFPQAVRLARSLLIPCVRNGNGSNDQKHISKGRKTMLRTITTFIRDEEGATAVEYGLMAALIAAVIIGVVTTLGTNLSAVFNSIAGQIKVN